MDISRATVSKWANRHRKFGETGLIDCSSAPVRQPTATPGETAARIEQLRREEKWSASRIAYELGADRSPVSRRTITRHLAQLRLNRRRFIDPNGETNREIRTITAKHPGHMVHLDVKKVGRITDGGGWRVHGKNSSEARAASRAKTRGARAGYAYLRSAIDGHTRLAYTEFTGERTSCHRRRVLEPRPRMVCQARHHEDRTDHHRQRRLLSLVRLRNSPARHHRRTRLYTPKYNDKVGRRNRAKAEEFLYARIWTSELQRERALESWNVHYNYHRPHGAHDGRPAAFGTPSRTTTSWPLTAKDLVGAVDSGEQHSMSLIRQDLNVAELAPQSHLRYDCCDAAQSATRRALSSSEMSSMRVMIDHRMPKGSRMLANRSPDTKSETGSRMTAPAASAAATTASTSWTYSPSE